MTILSEGSEGGNFSGGVEGNLATGSSGIGSEAGNGVEGVQAPPSTSSVNLDSKFGDILSDDLRQDKTLERFKDRSLKEYIHDSLEMRKTMGGMVKVPPADADFDTKQEYMYSVMDKLGFEKPPSTAGEYQFDMSSLPAGQEQDPVMTEFARDAFYEARLTNAQANAIIKKWNEQAANMYEKTYEQEKKAYDSAVTILKKEWGEHFDNNKRIVAATAQKIFPATLIDKFEAVGLGNDPEFLSAVLDIRKQYMSEHGVNPGVAGDAPVEGGLTTTEKMRKILLDPNFKTDISLQKEYSRLAELNAQTHKKVVR